MAHHRLKATIALTGTDKNDSYLGTDQDDTYNGLKGADTISGGAGSDHLYGGSGKDRLSGGLGQDVLYGGSGADTFVYASATEAGDLAHRDAIRDFKAGVDHLDVHAFMAGGHFIGSAAFAADEGPTLRYVHATGLLTGDVDGDGIADFAIKFSNHAHLTEADFIF